MICGRSAAHKPPVFIGKVYSKPIELIFKRVPHRRQRGIVGRVIFRAQALHARAPFHELRTGAHLIHAPEARPVRLLLKRRKRLAADALRGRIRQCNARFRFKRKQLVEERIVFRIAHLRRIESIIGLRVFIELFHKLLHAFLHGTVLPYCLFSTGVSGA